MFIVVDFIEALSFFSVCTISDAFKSLLAMYPWNTRMSVVMKDLKLAYRNERDASTRDLLFAMYGIAVIVRLSYEFKATKNVKLVNEMATRLEKSRLRWNSFVKAHYKNHRARVV